jgi:hypothetical protein
MRSPSNGKSGLNRDIKLMIIKNANNYTNKNEKEVKKISKNK